MKQYRYDIMNNAGHSWAALNSNGQGQEQNGPVLEQLLEEGWTPVRETPMGGGTSQLAHSLILLEKDAAPKAKARAKGVSSN